MGSGSMATTELTAHGPAYTVSPFKKLGGERRGKTRRKKTDQVNILCFNVDMKIGNGRL